MGFQLTYRSNSHLVSECSNQLVKRYPEEKSWGSQEADDFVGATALIAAIPVPGLSIVDDAALVFNEVRKYKVQLGIPEEGSERFGRLSSVTQKKFLDLNIKLANAIQLASEAVAEGFAGFARYIPFVGSVIAGASTYALLRDSLKEIEEVALAVLEQNCLILLRSWLRLHLPRFNDSIYTSWFYLIH